MPTDDSTKLPRLFLLRHGYTDWTDSHQQTGTTDLPLNPNGEVHARQLGARLRGKAFTQDDRPLDRNI